jgi:tetrahydromethanopterin S-methyltransferase subunit A
MMASGGYNSGFARSIRKDAHQLHVSVHDLQTDIAAGQSIRDVSGQVRQVCRMWDKTKNRMAKLNDTDRWNVSRFDGQIEPIMVKLKLVFEINS